MFTVRITLGKNNQAQKRTTNEGLNEGTVIFHIVVTL
jgi:hypothetical protein